MNLNDYSKENLWQLLVETVHASVMYHTHKAYTKSTVLPEQPNITPKELAHLLNMPLGEALIILDELIDKQTQSP